MFFLPEKPWHFGSCVSQTGRFVGVSNEDSELPADLLVCLDETSCWQLQERVCELCFSKMFFFEVSSRWHSYFSEDVLVSRFLKCF